MQHPSDTSQDWMPYEQVHGSMAVIKEPGMTAANVLNSGALENVTPLITGIVTYITRMHTCNTWAQRAHARNMGHMQSSAHTSRDVVIAIASLSVK